MTKILADGSEEEVLIREVVVGDVLVVKPGEKIPVDGEVTEGSSFVDESMITGESIPVEKVKGQPVYAGTINEKGSFRFRADKVGGETVLANIIRMVQEAQGSKAPVQKLVDRIAGIFVPVVMGILNVTPDSFYDGGRYLSEVKIVERIHQIMDEGADMIDVGAYSTRPGADYVDDREEIRRLLQAVELIRKHYPEAIVSIDTFRAKVAEEIVAAQGPVIVNDISGGTMDEGMFDYVTRTGVPYIMMHIQGTPQTMQKNPHYENIVKEVRKFLTDRIACLNAEGFDNIILDPGFGFGKTLAHNYELMNGLEHFQDLGYPLLVGISRKSMIYKLLGNSPAEALNGTAVLNTVSLLKGANILRVHDVREACEAVKIFKALSGEM